MPKAVVIDSDTYNEIDDQFAIAYALCSPRTLTVQALFAAPFVNEKAATPREGMEKSLLEMKRIRALCHSSVPAYTGSPMYLAEDGNPIQSAACDALIRLALAMPAGQKLYVVAIAALTNVASALLKEPAIKDRIIIYWLGAHAKDFPDQNEFNLRQDRRAAQVVFDSGAPIVWFPCRGVCSHLSLSIWEAEQWMAGRNALTDALLSLLKQSDIAGMGQTRVLWDVAPVAALCNPACIQTAAVRSPIVTEGPFGLLQDRHSVQYVQMIERDLVYADFFSAVSRFSQ
jgi:purine nucleosidase